MPPPIEITTTFVRDPHRRWSYLSLLVLVLPLPIWLLGGLWGALFMAATVALFVFVLRTRRAPVRVDEGGISPGGRRIARGAIGSGYVVPATKQATARVELNDRRRHVMVRIDAPEEVGNRILATLGLDASRHAAAFRGRWPLRSLRGALPALVHIGASVLFWKGGWLALIGYAASSILEILLGNRSIVVAGDGISVEHGLGSRWRFVPWSALYNETTEEETARRAELLGELFCRLGPRATIEPPFQCDYGANIVAGSDGVLCGPSVQLLTATHPLDAALRAAGPELARPIQIGSCVWLGGGVIGCPGVAIDNDTVVGAGSVVTKSLPGGVVAAGNPARIVRTL